MDVAICNAEVPFAYSRIVPSGKVTFQYESGGTVIPNGIILDLARVDVSTTKDEEVLSTYMNTIAENGDTIPTEVGRLNIVSYPALQNKVIIVPVNGVPLPSKEALTARLNNIYGQAMASWEVVYDEEQEKVVYKPVSITTRPGVPRIIRKDK